MGAILLHGSALEDNYNKIITRLTGSLTGENNPFSLNKGGLAKTETKSFNISNRVLTLNLVHFKLLSCGLFQKDIHHDKT